MGIRCEIPDTIDAGFKGNHARPFLMSTAAEKTAEPQHRRFSRAHKLSLAILLLLIALPLGYRAVEVLMTPDVAEPFDVEAFCAYKLPDERNAFTHYRKAVDLFVGEQKGLASDPSVKP